MDENRNLIEKQRIGRRIKNQRLDLRLTQKQLGAALGVSRETIANWEQARREVGSTEITALAHALKVSPAYFYNAEPTVQAIPPLGEGPGQVGAGGRLIAVPEEEWRELRSFLHQIQEELRQRRHREDGAEEKADE